MSTIITIPSPEDERLAAWEAKHNEAFHKEPADVVVSNQGAIGGRYTLEITQTSLGSVIVIRCACGAREDVTAYDEW